jgi:uncharacterized membrane-anchored protein YitT (DUF2179 family)
MRELLNLAAIAAGILSAGLGLKGFLLPNSVIDGGLTGAAMLAAKATGVPLAVWLPLVNLPFVLLGWRKLGTAFAARSVVALAGLSAALAGVPFPELTPDRVLVAIFGGFFIGAGAALTLRGGAALDATEIAARVIASRMSALPAGNVILPFNIGLFLIAVRTLGTDAALYSIVAYAAAARTVGVVLRRVDEYMAVTIVSPQSSAIRDRIRHALGGAVSLFEGEGGESAVRQDVLYCVATRSEVDPIKRVVREIDPAAFIASHALEAAQPGTLRLRGLH